MAVAARRITNRNSLTESDRARSARGLAMATKLAMPGPFVQLRRGAKPPPALSIEPALIALKASFLYPG
jgi:hypothetical protein